VVRSLFMIFEWPLFRLTPTVLFKFSRQGCPEEFSYSITAGKLWATTARANRDRNGPILIGFIGKNSEFCCYLRRVLP